MYGKRITAIPSRQLVPDHHMATNWWAQWWSDYGPAGVPCDPPTIQQFRVRFPEFADVPDATVQAALDDASCGADSNWSSACRDCQKAIMLLAAHYLALGIIAAQSMPDQGTGEGGTIIGGGQVTSLRFETMGVTFSAPRFAAGSGQSGGGPGEGPYTMEMTPYGQMYLDLLKVNQPAVVVV